MTWCFFAVCPLSTLRVTGLRRRECGISGKGIPTSKSTLLKSLRIKITTSSLAQNLKMGMLTKDVHFLCPSKPCVRDNTKVICGLESIKPDTSCPAEATPRSQVEVTQGELSRNRWLGQHPSTNSYPHSARSA